MREGIVDAIWDRQWIVAAACLALMFAASAPAQQQVETRVIVPDSPGGANFAGCFRATRDLFGPYRLTMCFERRGTYTIRGARGATHPTWRVSGRDIFIDLRRADCAGRVAWARASVTCRGTGNFMGTVLREVIPTCRLRDCRAFAHSRAPTCPRCRVSATRHSRPTAYEAVGRRALIRPAKRPRTRHASRARSKAFAARAHGHGDRLHGRGRYFSLPRTFAGATGPLGALVAWGIAASGMYALATVFRVLAERKPELDAGIYAYAKAGFGHYAGFLRPSAIGS